MNKKAPFHLTQPPFSLVARLFRENSLPYGFSIFIAFFWGFSLCVFELEFGKFQHFCRFVVALGIWACLVLLHILHLF